MFSKSCQYAIRAALYLGVHAVDGTRIGVRELADKLEVPQPFLAKVLQQMVRGHLISSVKGPRGGFFLSERNQEVTLKQIVLSIDGPDAFTSCILGLPVCSGTHPCPLHFQAMAYREGLHYQLKYQAVGDLAQRISRDDMNI